MKRLIALAASFLFMVSAASADTLISSGQWNAPKTANNNSSGPNAFWDHASSDGKHCNAGWILQGGIGSCNNVNVLGTAPNQPLAYLSANGNSNSAASFSFAPIVAGDKATYQFSIAGFNGDNLSNHDVFGWALVGCQLVNGVDTNHCLHPLFNDFNDTPNQKSTFTPGGNFRYYVAVYNTANSLAYIHFSDSVGDFNRDHSTPSAGGNFFALFSQTPTSQLTNYWIGVEDSKTALIGPFPGGDFDYQDMLIQISSVPEPASLLLLGTGLLGMAGSIRRKLGL